ncbi:hypothetical protein [Actinoplanes sp. NPDC051859]|uniref:hypothetical protein n=1 Tax=Actinoplanes sp. NPDC051859 TaxID=3363909 RepID=UPI0037AAA96C
MGNRFSGGGRELSLSNSATDVFQSVLQFALSDLAQTPWELAFARWFALHDQNLSGRGTVGFDLAEVPWDPAQSGTQRQFLVDAIDRALTRYRWDELCYDPPHAAEYLREFRGVVAAFEPVSTHDGPGIGWPAADEWEARCERHAVHCSDLGRCRVCETCPEP